MNWWGASNIGSRAENQDCFMLPGDESEASDFLLFGVFDGHGPQGKQAAHKARDSIYSFLTEKTTHQGTSIDASLMQASFHEAHSAILDTATTDFGTTAVVGAVHLPSSKFFFGWAGDSKAVIVRRCAKEGSPVSEPDCKSILHQLELPSRSNAGYYAIELTEDHVPTLPNEEDRVYANGGIIRSPFGMTRVFVPELYASFYGVRVGGLNMSRAIGHKFLSRFGVIPDPDFGVQTLLPDDLVIMASDGLWGKMTPTEVAQFIDSNPAFHNSPDKICTALIQESKKRWGATADNITIIVFLASGNTVVT